jgi:hypothetical protein
MPDDTPPCDADSNGTPRAGESTANDDDPDHRADDSDRDEGNGDATDAAADETGGFRFGGPVADRPTDATTREPPSSSSSSSSERADPAATASTATGAGHDTDSDSDLDRDVTASPATTRSRRSRLPAPIRRVGRLAAWPVWNGEYRRLRAPWRLVVAVVVLLVGTLATGTLGRLVIRVTTLPSVSPLVANTVSLAGGTVAVVLVGGVVLDRRRVADYGLGLDRDWAVDCAFGLGLGVALVAGIALVEFAAGWLTVTGTVRIGADGAVRVVLGAVGLFVLVGIYEEVLVRGYLLTNLAEGLTPLGERAAVALATLASSGVFGVAHASNPGSTLVSTLSVSLAGVVLALGYLLTGELAIPIGFHITWNATLGVGVGLPVSGLSFPASLLETRVDGPTAVTGGSFGPEAGLLGVVALSLGAVATVAYVRYRYGRVTLAPALTTPRLRWTSDPDRPTDPTDD